MSGAGAPCEVGRTPLRTLRPAVTGFALLLWLLCAAVWSVERSGAAPNVDLALPLAPGRSIQVKVWSMVLLEPDETPAATSARQIFDARWIGVWYQASLARPPINLAALRLPAWPLPTLASVAAAVAAALHLLPRAGSRAAGSASVSAEGTRSESTRRSSP